MVEKTTSNVTLARVDERTKLIAEQIPQLRDELKTAMAGLAIAIKESEVRLDTRATELGRGLRELEDDIEKKYISRSEFEPIKRFVYGLISVVLLAVFTAGLGMIIYRPPSPVPVSAVPQPPGPIGVH